MDIEYLLWLQNFREAGGDFLIPFTIWLSDFAHGGLLLVPSFVYWSVSKRGGMFLMLSLAVSNFLSEIIKMTCCVYRPFMKDPRVVPAVKRPSSYSFPSGHTMSAVPVLGGLAVLSRKKFVWLSWLCGLTIFLVMFSRNYLGYHTPQDVIGGLIAGLAVLYVVSAAMSHPEHENLFSALAISASIAGMVYISLKSYPNDVGADGKLLVKYASRIDDIYLFGGNLVGLVAGRILEKKYVNFRATGCNIKGLIVSLIGLGLYYALYFTVKKDFVNFLTPIITKNGGTFVHAFVSMIFTAAVWPLVIKKVCNNR